MGHGPKSKAFANPLPSGADETRYAQKSKELKAKLREVESENTTLQRDILKSQRNISRLRIERSVLYEVLAQAASDSILQANITLPEPAPSSSAVHHHDSSAFNDLNGANGPHPGVSASLLEMLHGVGGPSGAGYEDTGMEDVAAGMIGEGEEGSGHGFAHESRPDLGLDYDDQGHGDAGESGVGLNGVGRR